MNKREDPEYLHDPPRATPKPRAPADHPTSNPNGQPTSNQTNNDFRNNHMDDPRQNQGKGSGGRGKATPLSQMKLKNENVMTAI